METEDHLPRTMSNDARIRPAGKRTDDGKRAGAGAEAAQAFQDARLPGQRRSDGESVMTGAGFWSGKKVLVTGGGGFIWFYVGENLVKKRGGASAGVVVSRSRSFDLRPVDNCPPAVGGCQGVI